MNALTSGHRSHTSCQQDESPTRPVTSGRRLGTPAVERKRRQRQREKDQQQIVYETADWQLFMSLATLPQKAGCQPRDLSNIILKELVDNALDAGAGVSLNYADGAWTVADDGPGLDPAEVPRLFAVNRPLRSSKLRRLPLRGMLGNGLRVVVGAVAATDGVLTVETRGHRLILETCRQTGQTIVVSDEPVPWASGLTVRISSEWVDRRDGILARSSIALSGVGKTYTGPSSPWWYGIKDLVRIFSDVTPVHCTVGTICQSFGLSLDDDRPARALDQEQTAAVLESLRTASKPIPPEDLGFIGKDCNPGWAQYDGDVSYARRAGTTTTQAGAHIPYVVEVWVSCSRSIHKGQGSVRTTTIINRSVTVAQINATSSPGSIAINGCGLSRWVHGPGTGHYVVFVSVIAPYVQLATDGKEPSLAPFSEAIAETLRKACGAAHRAMERPDRAVSIKEAAWSVMVEAYRIASGDGRYPANARQIMYAARPDILRLTGKSELDDAYFTQTLLPDYVAEHGKETEWDVAFDARGSFIEPHTGREVRLGTIDVRAYLGERPALGPVADLTGSERYPTTGPKHRYSAILFIEKEGFTPLLQAARIAERFDIAIMSSKGMSTTAARLLLDRLAPKIETILVMHDFDVSGFSIFGTLHTDGRRYSFKNDLPIVDIGLRLTDVQQLGLQSEPVKTAGSWRSRSATLKEHGATQDEIDFLATRRVELNAMAADVFVGFLERKLVEHGVHKAVPERDILEHHARRMIEQQLAEKVLRQRRAALQAEAAAAMLPDDLDDRVRAALLLNPALSWDLAVAAVIQTEAAP